MASYSASDLQLLKSLFSQSSPFRPSFLTAPPLSFLSAAQWRWGLSVILSRSFQGGYVLPFVDFANHASNSSAVFLQVIKTAKNMEYAVFRGFVSWSLSRNCSQNEEIFLNYGTRDAIHFETAFGHPMAGKVDFLWPHLNGTAGMELFSKSANKSASLCRNFRRSLEKKSAGFGQTLGLIRQKLWECEKNEE
jgi:hypothetical protein